MKDVASHDKESRGRRRQRATETLWECRLLPHWEDKLQVTVRSQAQWRARENHIQMNPRAQD